MHERFINGLVGATILVLGLTLLVLFFKQSPPMTSGQYYNSDVAPLIKKYDVSYPTFHDARLDRVVTSYIKTEINAFERSLAEKTDPRNHITITYEVVFSNARIMSLVFNQEKRIVGEPVVNQRSFLTLDIANKKAVAFADVFKREARYQDALARLLHDFFKQETQLSPANLVSILELNFASWSDFTITNDALVLYLNPHNVADKNQLVSVVVKKELIADLLASEYITLEGGNKLSTPSYIINAKPAPGDTINPSQKMLALTFDDGPSEYTPELLQTLYKYEAHATFFVLGQKVHATAPTLQRIIRDGNEIGNHSWNHPDLRSLSVSQLAYQINDTQTAITQAVGAHPVLMRPPYGFTNGHVATFLQQQGLRQVMWTVDTNDWRDKNEQVIYDRIMASSRDGAVILLHDIHPTSVAAAQKAIPQLKAQGYQLVTLSQLYNYR